MISIKNQKVIEFYKKRKHIDIDGINLVFVELLEKLEKNMTETINQNLSVELLKDLSSKILSIEQQQKEQDTLLKTIDERTREYGNNLKSNLDMCVLSQKETIVREIHNTIKSNDTDNSKFIHKMISDNHELLSEKIQKNLEKLPVDLQQTVLSKQDIETALSLTKETILSELAKVNSVQNFSEELGKIMDSKYTAFNASLSSRVDTVLSSSNSTLSDILERLKPMASVEEHFSSLRNSNIKGKCGENKLEPILSNLLPDANVINSSGNAQSGDFIIERKDKSKILIDTKDYNTSVPPKEVEKIIRDVNKHKCNGILLSQNSGIALKHDYEISINNNFVIVYVHNVQYNEDKIYVAIQIIDTLFPILQSQANLDHESISSDLLNTINKEFQAIVEQKKNIVEQMEKHNKDMIREINKIDIPSLATFLSTKFAQAKQLNFVCDICNEYSGKNARSLAAHKRGCIRKKNPMLVLQTNNE